MDDNYEGYGESQDTIFVAYSRKLLKALLELRKHIEDNNIDDALCLLNEIIEDTEQDLRE